jgi:hypothetical protein
MIKEVTMYTVVCDSCGKDSCEGSEYAGYSDKDYAIDVARDGDFVRIEGNDYCPDCYEYDDDDELKVIIR